MAANALRFATQPTGYTSEGVLTTQPVVEAYDTATGLVDASFVGVVTLTPNKASTRFYTTTDLLSTTHTVQAGSTASAVIVSPALSFPATLPPSYNGQDYYCFISSSGGAVAQYARRLLSGNTGTTQLDLLTPFGAVPTTGSTIKVRSGVVPPAVAATCVNGVATFTGLSLMGWETTALVASSPGLTSATSSPMTPTGTRDGPAELPRATVDTSVPTQAGATLLVPSAYATIQLAVNAANLGDTIVLEAGAVLGPGTNLPKKTTGSGWIVIKGHVDPCAPGTRCKPSDFAGNNIAKVVVTAGGQMAFACDSGAHHYRLQGFEITHNADSNGLVNFTDRISENNGTGLLADIPHHFVVDRMYIHDDGTHDVKYAVKLNCGEAGVVDSYLTAIDRNNDCQAIADFAGVGPYRIHNNFCQSPSENIIFGGADPYVLGAVTSDVTITNNYCYKPLAWKSDVNINGKIKNLLELKSVRRCRVEGNVLEFNWPAGQAGDSIVLSPVNQSATAVNAGLRDVTFRKNVIRNVASGFQITEENSELGVRSLGFWRFAIHDNAMWNVNDPAESNGGGNHRCYSLFDGCYDTVIRHNTTLGSPNATSADTRAVSFNDPTRPAARSKFDDNLTTAQGYAFIASGDTPGGPSINHCLLNAGGTCNNNALVDFQPVYGGTGYPASTLFPATLANVGVANSGITSTWDTAPIDTVLAALTVTTAGTPDLRTAASDGTAVGANMTLVRAAVTGVVEGTPGTGGGTATQLLLSTPPAGAVSGMTLTTQPAGTVADSGGSTVTSDTSTITASWVLLTGDAVPTGTMTTTASSGAWAFTTLGLSWSSPSTGYWHFTDGALTAVNSATMILPVATPTASLVLPTVVDQWRPTQRNREGLEVVPSASPLIGTGGTTVANSGTTSVLIPVGRVKVSVLSLSLDAMTAAGSAGTVTVQAFKVSGGVSSALTTAQSIKSDVISASGNIVLPVLTSLFDGASNGTRRIDGTRGDTLRVDVVAAGTITTQPVVRVVAELAVNS